MKNEMNKLKQGLIIWGSFACFATAEIAFVYAMFRWFGAL